MAGMTRHTNPLVGLRVFKMCNDVSDMKATKRAAIWLDMLDVVVTPKENDTYEVSFTIPQSK